jgi:hypothetical protein
MYVYICMYVFCKVEWHVEIDYQLGDQDSQYQ